MATIVSSIGTGKDYTTIAAWESAKQGDLITAGNIEKGEMYNESFSAGVTIDGSTTNSSNYLWLVPASGEQHSGKEGTGAKITANGNAVINLNDDYTLVEFIEIDGGSTAQGSSQAGVGVNRPGCSARNMIIHGFWVSQAWRSCVGISINQNDTDSMNNIIYDIKNTASGTITEITAGIIMGWSEIELYNNTIYDITNPSASVKLAYGIYGGTGAAASSTLKNDVCMGCDTADFGFAVSFTGTASNNGSSDGTAPGTSPQLNKTASSQFVNLTDDFRLKSGADMIDNGVDLIQTPAGVEIDINGIDRDADGDLWDIGAHLFIDSGGGMPAVSSTCIVV